MEGIDTISKTPVNVRLLSKDRKLKLTAIALGELKEQMEQKEFEHENGMD